MVQMSSVIPAATAGVRCTQRLLLLGKCSIFFGHKVLRVSKRFSVVLPTGKTQHSINLLTSWIAGSDPGADYRYGATGIAYSLNYRGIFLELGLAMPWRDDIGNLANDPVVPCGYLGYICIALGQSNVKT